MNSSDPQYLYKENKYYKLFIEEKEELKSKYPKHIFDVTHRPYTEEDREQHLQYLKELGDIIFTPNSNYQEFTWDIMAEVDKEEMKKRARGRMYGQTEY